MTACFLNSFKISDMDQLFLHQYLDLGLFWFKKIGRKV